MRTPNALLVENGDMSGSINSNPFRLEHLNTVAIQAVFTGSSPTGTFKVQVSNDTQLITESGDIGATVNNWSDVSGSSVSVTASGDVAWNLPNTGFRWVRVVYTRSSGSGTLNVRAQGKGL